MNLEKNSNNSLSPAKRLLGQAQRRKLRAWGGLGWGFSLHLLMVLLLTLVRVLMMLLLNGSMNDEAIPASLYVDAIVMGIRLDNIVVAYTSALPFLLVLLASMKSSFSAPIMVFLRWYYVVVHTLLLIVAFANIPYSNEFLHPIDLSSLTLLNNGFETFHMLLADWHFYIYLLVFAVVAPLYVCLILRISNMFASAGKYKLLIINSRKRVSRSVMTNSLLFLAFAAFLFLSIRGFKTAGHPLNSTDAYISENHFVNLCAQSPVLYFVNSITRYQRLNSISFYEDDEMAKNTQEFYGTTFVNAPWLHHVSAPDSALLAGRKPNVVLIMMESMSVHYMQSFGQKEKLTPFLDSLYQRSLHFSNCYSAGFRTGQGILGVLCSWPSIMNRNITHEFRLSEFGGLATELGKEGYSTTFFVSHDPNFDGLYDFLSNNGIQKLYSMDDYPEDRRVGVWGVPDDFLYSFALDAINKKKLGNSSASANAPFFATILSISNHPPYDLPKKFRGRFDSDEYNAIQYADESLRQFFAEAERQPWFDNTVFILVGDHGLAMEKAQECELPDMINHVPLIFYSKLLPVREYSDVVSQNDIAATLLSLIGHSYDTNSLSHDAINSSTPYIIYSDGEHIACRSNSHLFLYNYNNNVKRYYRVTGYSKVETTEPNDDLLRMERYCLTTYQLELNQLKGMLK